MVVSKSGYYYDLSESPFREGKYIFPSKAKMEMWKKKVNDRVEPFKVYKVSEPFIPIIEETAREIEYDLIKVKF